MTIAVAENKKETVLAGTTDEFVSKIKNETKEYRARVRRELSRVKPGHPQYLKLKKTDLRCARIIKNLDEMNQERVSIY